MHGTASFKSRIDRLLSGREPVVTTRQVLLLATWFGAVAGVFQLLPHVWPYLTSRDPLLAAAYNTLWLSPLAGALTFFIVAVVGSIVLLAVGGRVSLDVVVFPLSFVTWLTLAGEPTLRLNMTAAAVLALGLAVQTTRVAQRRKAGLLRLARRSLPVFAVLIAVTAAMDRGATTWRARMALQSLGPAAPGSTNVVLLILDTVRADALSLYGYERPTTPNIDAWADAGAVFTHAFSTSPWTLPAHASMFTGQWPDRLSADFHVPLDEEWPTVAESFASHGYATAAFVANWTYGRRVTGLNRGFAHYDDAAVNLATMAASFRWSRAVLVRTRKAMGNRRSPRRRDAAVITDRFVDWLDDRPAGGTRPFFAFLNYFDAHHPYEMPPSFETRFAATAPRYWMQTGGERNITAAEKQELRDAYDSALAFLDQEIGRLRVELDRRGILENTLVIITADHGEHFGERGIYTHANSLYAPLLHVPLVMVLPGVIPDRTVIDEPVSVRDLAATMVEMIPDTLVAFPGFSLFRYLEEGLNFEPDLLQAELRPNALADEGDPIARGMMTALIRGPYHFILNGDGAVELYDYVRDPLEQNDLAGAASSGDVMERFRSASDSILRSSSGNDRGQVRDSPH